MLRYFNYSILVHLGIFCTISLYQALPGKASPFSLDVQASSINKHQKTIQMEALNLQYFDENISKSANARVVEKKERNKKENNSGKNNRTEIIRGKISNYLLEIEYPPLARHMGMEGRVIIRIYVDHNGNLSRKELIKSSGYALLDTAAMKGVSGWSFGPGEEESLVVPVLFRLK